MCVYCMIIEKNFKSLIKFKFKLLPLKYNNNIIHEHFKKPKTFHLRKQF